MILIKTTGLAYMGHTLSMFCGVRRLLALTSFTGFINLLYLLLYVDTKGNLEFYSPHTSSVFRRQIASVEMDTDAKPTGRSFLELLNLDLKDIVERYMASSATVEKHYTSHHSVKGDSMQHQKRFTETFLPRCSPSPFLLIVVHSSPENFMDRESIRLSWGREDNPINQGSWTTKDR